MNNIAGLALLVLVAGIALLALLCSALLVAISMVSIGFARRIDAWATAVCLTSDD